MFIYRDNHILVKMSEFRDFQNWLNELLSNADEPEKKKLFVIQAVSQVFIKFILKAEEIDKSFYVLEVDDLTEHIEKLIANEGTEKFKLKAYADIRDFPEIFDVDIVFHKNKTFQKQVFMENDEVVDVTELLLYQILLVTSSYIDTVWKAEKAIVKNTTSVIDSQIRLCYMGQAELDEAFITEPDPIETEIQQAFETIPELANVSKDTIDKAVATIKRAQELMKAFKN